MTPGPPPVTTTKSQRPFFRQVVEAILANSRASS